jgi:DNA-directed RNA polymerase specialized sigma24 family protein
MDICQSVLASFFLGALARQYDLHDPRQLVALLTTMAQRKLAARARGHYRQRRDVRRTELLGDQHRELPSRESDPGRQVADRDLLQQAFALMSPQVREIADLRLAGAPWSDIADRLGGTAEGRRKQYQRAMASIAGRLGLD